MGRAIIKNGYHHYWCTLVGDKSAADVIHAARRSGRSILDWLLRAHVKARRPLKTLEEREAFDKVGLRHLPSMHEELLAVLSAEAYGRKLVEGPQEPQGATNAPKGTPQGSHQALKSLLEPPRAL